jgi:hypothetical protein
MKHRPYFQVNDGVRGARCLFGERRARRERVGQLIVFKSCSCRHLLPQYCHRFERRYIVSPSCHNDDRDTQVVAKHVAVNLRRHWNKKNDDNDRVVDELKVGKMRMKDDINSNVSI